MVDGCGGVVVCGGEEERRCFLLYLLAALRCLT